MTFGKYKGRDLADIDDESYLRWALESATTVGPTLREAIRARLGLPPTPPDSQQVAQVVSKMRDVLRSVYRDMSARFHPDRGGSNAAMSAINRMHDSLQEAMTKSLPDPNGTTNQDHPF
jgi:hypothetical protein